MSDLQPSAPVSPTAPPPLRVSDAQLAAAAREARIALANGWWEARYELDIDHRKAADS